MQTLRILKVPPSRGESTIPTIPNLRPGWGAGANATICYGREPGQSQVFPRCRGGLVATVAGADRSPGELVRMLSIAKVPGVSDRSSTGGGCIRGERCVYSSRDLPHQLSRDGAGTFRAKYSPGGLVVGRVATDRSRTGEGAVYSARNNSTSCGRGNPAERVPGWW